jgi:pimeloyl-ACP methyl ester carboxylesterase
MANFVLVHGAWHGAWCWQRVNPLLAARRHRVHAVTLTGVGERAHLRTPAVDLETHIADVANLIEAEELQDVVLAVHSYAGMIGTAIADRMPARIRHLVYIDAVIPEPGESSASRHAPETRHARIAACAASADFSYPPPDASAYGLVGEDHAWVNRRQSRQPGRCYIAPLEFDPARVTAVSRTFVDCVAPALATIDASRRRVRDPGFWGAPWSVVELRTGHDAMVSAPNDLAQVLLACGD